MQLASICCSDWEGRLSVAVLTFLPRPAGSELWKGADTCAHLTVVVNKRPHGDCLSAAVPAGQRQSSMLATEP